MNIYFKKLSVVALLMLTSVSSTFLMAAENKILDSITQEMDRISNIATKTKENEDYQPYIISVFHAKELEKLGVLNLKEALSLVPGADMATDNFNNQVPIFRGSNPLSYGQSELMIDGVSVNNLFFDGYSEYLSLPIEMIKRIEVVRGPGSNTNSIKAYAGSINVITYAEDLEDFEQNDKIVLKAGSYKYKMGGFVKTYKEENFKLFSDFYYQEDEKKLSSGYDALSQGLFSFGAPANIDNTALSQSGDVPLWLKSYSLGITLKYKDFYLKSRTMNHEQGAAYGYLYMLPQESDYLKQPSHYLEFGFDKNIGNYEVNINIGAKYGTFDYNAKVAPDGFQTYTTLFNDGMYGEYYAAQRTLYQSGSLKYKGIQNHILKISYRLIKEETIDMSYKFSDLITGDATPIDYTKTRPFFDENAKRDTYRFSFEDKYCYSDTLNFIYGFNYEKTSLENSNFYPMVSVVHQYNTKNIFKAMYTKSGRNPSWQEMFINNNHVLTSNTDLISELVDAYEAAYIRKFSSDSHLEVNIFYLNNKEQIYNTSAHPDYANTKNTDIYGTEMEYKGNISDDDKIYLNYSYVQGEDNYGESLANVAQHMAKAYYIYDINNALSLSSIAKYVGSKKREAKDNRKDLSDYSTLDASLHYKNKKYNYSLTLSAKNIFDTTIKHPSPCYTYSDDYTQDKRSFLITFVKRL